MATTSRHRTITARPAAGNAKSGRGRGAAGKRNATSPPVRHGHGGARPGAGRKPNIPGQPGVDHDERAPLARQFPVLVTIKLRAGLPGLHGKPAGEVLRAAFAAGCERDLGGRFRLCHFAILSDRLHLICEAEGRTALGRGLQGLQVRIARSLNKLWSRRGKLFADRYDDRILKSPSEVRDAIRLVFGLAPAAGGKQEIAGGRAPEAPEAIEAIEAFTSAPWSSEWRPRRGKRELDTARRPVAPARTRLLIDGWARHGPR